MAKKEIGLALGGGGAKGFAHVGVLKFLEEKKIPISQVSGTSMGAIVGAMHCLGYKAKEIEDIIKKTNFRYLLHISIPRKGLIKSDRVEDYLRKLFEGKKFSDLKKPLFVMSCDIKNAQKVIFNQGDLAKAVMASSSIPGIFQPVMTKNRILIDGGVLDNLPIKVLKEQGIQNIIAVNLEAEKINREVYATAVNDKKDEAPGIMETLKMTSELISSEPLQKTLEDPENTIIISPDLEKIDIQNFDKAREAIKIGYNAAKEKFSQIQEMYSKA